MTDRIRARVDWATTHPDFLTGRGTATDLDTGEAIAFTLTFREAQDLALRVALFAETPDIELLPNQVILRRVQ